MRTIVLVTTLLHPIAFPARPLENSTSNAGGGIHFREIKTLLGLDILRCLSPQMVHKELLLQIIAYN